MFSSLSFKKLRRRLRAITFFTKKSKKSNKKQKEEGRQGQDGSATRELSVHEAPVTGPTLPPVVELALPSITDLDVSPTKACNPPLPAKANQPPIDTVRTLSTNTISEVAHILTEPERKQSLPSRSEPTLLQTHTQTRSPSANPNSTPTPSYPAATLTSPSDHIKLPRSTRDDVGQREVTTLDIPESASPPHHHHADEAGTEEHGNVDVESRTERGTEVLETPCGGDVGRPVVLELPVVQDTEAKTDGPIDDGTAVVELDTPLVVDSPIQETQPTPQGPPLGNPSQAPAHDTPHIFPLVVRTNVPESPRDAGMVMTVPVQSPLEYTSESPPQTPSSPNTKRVRTPSTPRKRIASEVVPNQDTSIMSELQASVRSREKRRLEREKAEAVEKKREEMELRRDVLASMGREVTELGAWKDGCVDSGGGVDAESVAREVRTWRKEREASLKGQAEEIAKAEVEARAIRETLSDEKIMVDLMAAVQNRAASRSASGACFVDPREKRQTMLLEDMFARRVAVGQV